jgi:hypothetical protein
MGRCLKLIGSLLVVMIGLMTAAQAADPIVGTWKLVSVQSRSLQGQTNATAFGEHPTGFATFTSQGRMSLIMADDNRKPLSVVDRVSAPIEERAQAFATCVAYAGRYTFTGDKVVFHVEASSIQNWVNTDLTRSVVFDKNLMSLKTMTTLKGGVLQTIETTWVRVD